MLIIHVVVTAALVGLIWTIQIVHYPLFAKVGTGQWAEYHRSHTSRITFVVVPLMFAELGLALYLAVFPPVVSAEDTMTARLMWWALGMTVVVWISTFGIQVPLHGRLARGFDERSVSLLVGTNWVRTAGWTIKLVVLCVAVLRVNTHTLAQ